MEAMYDTVASALSAAGSDRTPMDYLQFMCLARREAGPQEGPQDVKGKAGAGILSHRCNSVHQMHLSQILLH